MSESEKPDAIEPLVEALLKEIGEEPGRDGLLKTPRRVAKSMRALLGVSRDGADCRLDIVD